MTRWKSSKMPRVAQAQFDVQPFRTLQLHTTYHYPAYVFLVSSFESCLYPASPSNHLEATFVYVLMLRAFTLDDLSLLPESPKKLGLFTG